MRGASFCHRFMIESITHFARQRGAHVELEQAIWLGRSYGYTDAFIQRGDLRIAVEAELSARRVGNDVRKALTLHATHLLIVTPTARMARECERELARYSMPAAGPKALVCTLGMALHRLSSLFRSSRMPVPLTPSTLDNS